jgi:hypothetical protein
MARDFLPGQSFILQRRTGDDDPKSLITDD